MAPPAPLYPNDRNDKEKRCTKCGNLKPLASFPKRPEMRDGRDSQCKGCSKVLIEEWKAANDKRVKERAANVDLSRVRPCTKCREEKPLSEFGYAPYCADGRHTQCNECRGKTRRKWDRDHREYVNAKKRADPKVKERNKSWRLKNPEIMKEHMRKFKEANPDYDRMRTPVRRFKSYGVDESWYAETLAAQGGGCAICGSTDPKTKWATFSVDHNHQCCKKSCTACDNCRRALLCATCNTRLGHLESIEWLSIAIPYLAKHNSLGPIINAVLAAKLSSGHCT